MSHSLQNRGKEESHTRFEPYYSSRGTAAHSNNPLPLSSGPMASLFTPSTPLHSYTLLNSRKEFLENGGSASAELNTCLLQTLYNRPTARAFTPAL